MEGGNCLYSEQGFCKNRKKLVKRKNGKGRFSFNCNEILYMEAERQYTRVFLSEKEIVLSENIGKLSEKLPKCFIRISKSFLVNLFYAKDFITEGRSAKIIIINNSALSVSKRRISDIRKAYFLSR